MLKLLSGFLVCSLFIFPSLQVFSENNEHNIDLLNQSSVLGLVNSSDGAILQGEENGKVYLNPNAIFVTERGLFLKTLRDQIDAIDTELVALLGKRVAVAREIARIKKREKLPIFDPNREDEIKAKVKKLAGEHQISPLIMEEIFQLLLDYSKIEMKSI